MFHVNIPADRDARRPTSRTGGTTAAKDRGLEPARQPGGCSLMFVETRHGKDIKAERGKKTGSRDALRCRDLGSHLGSVEGLGRIVQAEGRYLHRDG